MVRQGAATPLGRGVQVSLEITTNLSGTAQLTCKLGDLEIEGTHAVTGSSSSQTVVFDCMLKKLPGTVQLLKDVPLPWQLELAGESRTLNSPAVTLYVVDEAPKDVSWPDPDNHNWFDWVLEYSCRWASGTTEASAVFNAIWNRFSDGTQARVPHETGWAYWGTSQPVQVLAGCPGKARQLGWSCRAICHFYMMAIAVHGIECSDVEPVALNTATYELFMVATWTFTGNGDQFVSKKGPPGVYYAGAWNGRTPPGSLAANPQFIQDARRSAAPGQGQPNPPLGFSNHWIVRLTATSQLYDTSYGGSARANMAAYQPAAISGWLYGTSGHDYFIVKAHQNSLTAGPATGQAHT